jgi:hypothetical protein
VTSPTNGFGTAYVTLTERRGPRAQAEGGGGFSIEGTRTSGLRLIFRVNRNQIFPAEIDFLQDWIKAQQMKDAVA